MASWLIWPNLAVLMIKYWIIRILRWFANFCHQNMSVKSKGPHFKRSCYIKINSLLWKKKARDWYCVRKYRKKLIWKIKSFLMRCNTLRSNAEETESMNKNWDKLSKYWRKPMITSWKTHWIYRNSTSISSGSNLLKK